VVAAITVYFLMQPDERSYVVAGDVDDFAAGEPAHFEGEGFFIVRLESGELFALHDRATGHLNEPVDWRPELEFQGHTGWFRSVHRETYDLTGALVFGPATRGLDRFPVEVIGGEVRVDTSRLICGPGAPAGTVCTP
jgi:nitrite reductase/ring-hydroxylating ferredoxin subunit